MVVDPNTMAFPAAEVIALVGKINRAGTTEIAEIYMRVLLDKLALIEAQGYARCLEDRLKRLVR